MYLNIFDGQFETINYLIDSMKKLIVLGILILNQLTTFSQSSSSDLSFYNESAFIEFADDSAMYPNDIFQQLILECDIDDVANLGVLHIELSQSNGQIVLFKFHYTVSEMLSNGYLINNHFKKSFGNFMFPAIYDVNLTLETKAGFKSSTISKTLSI